MRKARVVQEEFYPQSAEDVVEVLRGELPITSRWSTSYWEMAASLVNIGVIDWKRFMEAKSREPVQVFAKLHPYLEQLRSMFASKYDDAKALQRLEQVVMNLPHARERIAERLEQFSELRTRTQQNMTPPVEAAKYISKNSSVFL